MKHKNKILLLRQSAQKLQEIPEFRGIAVITLAMALEKQIKNVVVYNYN